MHTSRCALYLCALLVAASASLEQPGSRSRRRADSPNPKDTSYPKAGEATAYEEEAGNETRRQELEQLRVARTGSRVGRAFRGGRRCCGLACGTVGSVAQVLLMALIATTARELYSGEGAHCQRFKQQVRLMNNVGAGEGSGLNPFLRCVGDGVVSAGYEIVNAGDVMQQPRPLERLHAVTSDTTNETLVYLEQLAHAANQSGHEAYATGERWIGETRNASAETLALIQHWIESGANTSSDAYARVVGALGHGKNVSSETAARWAEQASASRVAIEKWFARRFGQANHNA